MSDAKVRTWVPDCSEGDWPNSCGMACTDSNVERPSSDGPWVALSDYAAAVQRAEAAEADAQAARDQLRDLMDGKTCWQCDGGLIYEEGDYGQRFGDGEPCSCPLGRIATLEADKRRLDWLEATPARVIDPMEFHGDTIRAAIDAAMQAEKAD